MNLIPDPITNINTTATTGNLTDQAKALSAALDAIPELQRRIAAARATRVQQMHDTGMTWQQVGDELGLHYARASQIARGVSGGKKRKQPAADE